MFVSQRQRKGRMEKTRVTWDMQDCHTEGHIVPSTGHGVSRKHKVVQQSTDPGGPPKAPLGSPDADLPS